MDKKGEIMINRKFVLALVCIVMLMFVSCAGSPKVIEPQFSQWEYIDLVPLDPQLPVDSPQLEVALSLLQMKFPKDQAEFFNDLLYSSGDLTRYGDQVIQQQRDKYHVEFPEGNGGFNWRYMEDITVSNTEYAGIVIMRELVIYTGGAHGLVKKQYYVIDLDSRRQVTLDDLFQDCQGEKIRSIIYSKLRDHSGLGEDQPLSEGIYLTDDPELSTNFYVTNEGLGLHWNPYEISPYYSGGINIIVPWREIRPQMLHSGMELLTKFHIYLFV